MYKLLMLLIMLPVIISAKTDILYWNFNTDKQFNKNKIDFEYIKESFNTKKFDLIILNNLPSFNLPPRFGSPYKELNSPDTILSKKESSYNIIMKQYNSNKEINIRRYSFPDMKMRFPKNFISGYIVNNEIAIIILNFKEESLNNRINYLKNMNYVIDHIIKEKKILKENILIVGNLLIDKNEISSHIPGFKDYLNFDGSKIGYVKERGFTGYKLVESDLFISNRKIKVNPFFDNKENLLNGKYKGKENTKKYIMNVFDYIPIHIEF